MQKNIINANVQIYARATKIFQHKEENFQNEDFEDTKSIFLNGLVINRKKSARNMFW